MNTFLDFDELVRIGESRLSRGWKPEERRKYLHEEEGGQRNRLIEANRDRGERGRG